MTDDRAVLPDPKPYQLDYARGVAAQRAGEPYDDREAPGWCIGYGDAIMIEALPDGEEPE